MDAFALAFRVHRVGLGDALIAAFLRLEGVAFSLALGCCLSADAVAIKEILVFCKGTQAINIFVSFLRFSTVLPSKPSVSIFLLYLGY